MTKKMATRKTATQAPTLPPVETQEFHPPTVQVASDIILNPVAMEQIEKIANYMASSKATIPKHLMGSVSDCVAVCLQAATWGMNPWPVAQKTHLIHGRLGYEAQLVNAVIISRAPVKGRPNYEWYGNWDKILGKHIVRESKKQDAGSDEPKTYAAAGWKSEDEEGLGVIVSCTLIGEDEPRVLDIKMVQAYPRNSTLWATDPRQQLAYLGLKRWAALYAPDVVLGVYTPEELQQIAKEEKDITPSEPPTKKQKKPTEKPVESVDQKSDIGGGEAAGFQPDDFIPVETVGMITRRLNHRKLSDAEFLEHFKIDTIEKLTKGQLVAVNKWFDEKSRAQ